MNIIEEMQLYWKVRFSKLSWYEFRLLLVEVDHPDSLSQNIARKMLKTYVLHHTLAEDEVHSLLDIGTTIGTSVFDVIIEAYTEHNHILPDKLVEQMIERGSLKELEKIVRILPMSSAGEKMLIAKARKEPNFNPTKQGTAGNVLAAYLTTNVSSSVCADKDVQSELSFDDRILHLFIRRCTIKHNYLCNEIIARLINFKCEKLLNHLLSVSYIDNGQIQEELRRNCPSLCASLMISNVRRQVYEFEVRHKQNLGGNSMSTEEMALELHTPNPEQWSPEERQKFMDEKLQPFMEMPYSTPSFLAWVAYHFPKLAVPAAKKLESVPEKLREAELMNNEAILNLSQIC